ncbi:integrin beta-PS-like [Athalia rosae]|uniref:integrin beta-PS-like n=1 Tax=Athalia rosae TaxID=37344 RepID=UPI0020346D90|nr:integrin beta-PS-like [Athalia rosae]
MVLDVMYLERRAAVLFICFFLSSVFLLEIRGQTKTSGDPCTVHQTCGACIRTPKCMWCGEDRQPSDHLGVGSPPRCVRQQAAGVKGGNWCRPEMIVDQTSSMKILKEYPFSSIKDKQVQIKPQRMKLVMRRGEEQTFSVYYKQAEDYPVDLYFLMDLSASMESDRDNLSRLGLQLAKVMRRLTANFRLGFGSFVDKVVLPMTCTQPEWASKMCKLLNGSACAPSYGYKNQMPLTNNVSKFEEEVKSAPISGNLDLPEGGLDAIMQTIVCSNEVGWRDHARHLLVYSSDDTFHIAGDGKLAGIVEPNDELCHLDKNGFYTHAELLDYPSIAQIEKQAHDHNVNIIFAVVPEKRDIYELLSSRINGSSVGILDENSMNVVDLVTGEYEKLTNVVTMASNASGMLEVKFFSNCLETDSKKKPQERNQCSGVRVDTILKFDVTIKATDCPENPEDWRQTIEIKPQAVNERLIVDVEVICDCPCSRPGHQNFIPKSDKCNGNGNLTCGTCACDEGYFGKQCDCLGDNVAVQSAETMVCRGDKSTTAKVCSGHGACVCGACSCYAGPKEGEKFYGEFCQCDNFSCPRSGGQVCGGPDRGRCDCKSCVCQSGWGGEACDCRTTNSTCYPPGENSKICSGFGDCICGQCVCDKTEGRGGQFCEECPTCPNQRCDELKDCVECFAYQEGPEFDLGPDCPRCLNIDVETVDKLSEDPNAYNKDTHVCPMPDSSGGTFIFIYTTTRGDTSITEVTAEKEKKHPAPTVSAYSVAGGVIGLTLFLGLLGLLIWKILTMFHDHREWVKFEKERVSANWGRGENPLFKAPTSTFNNPTFGENTKS